MRKKGQLNLFYLEDEQIPDDPGVGNDIVEAFLEDDDNDLCTFSHLGKYIIYKEYLSGRLTEDEIAFQYHDHGSPCQILGADMSTHEGSCFADVVSREDGVLFAIKRTTFIRSTWENVETVVAERFLSWSLIKKFIVKLIKEERYMSKQYMRGFKYWLRKTAVTEGGITLHLLERIPKITHAYGTHESVCCNCRITGLEQYHDDGTMITEVFYDYQNVDDDRWFRGTTAYPERGYDVILG